MDDKVRQLHEGHVDEVNRVRALQRQERAVRDRTRRQLLEPLLQAQLDHHFGTPVPQRHRPLPSGERMDPPGSVGTEFGGCVY